VCGSSQGGVPCTTQRYCQRHAEQYLIFFRPCWLQNKDAVGTSPQSGTYWGDNCLAWHYRVLTGYSRVPWRYWYSTVLQGTNGYTKVLTQCIGRSGGFGLLFEDMRR
jgi:hypothetical protein